jgi:hypothetical protein
VAGADGQVVPFHPDGGMPPPGGAWSVRRAGRDWNKVLQVRGHRGNDDVGNNPRGMKTTRIARKLGLDGNPLRRRTDKIAARFTALLLAVFLIAAPLLSVAAAGWASHHGAAELQAKRSWRQVSAVLLQGAPAPTTGGVLGYYQVLARWTIPGGRARTGRIPVSAGMAAGPQGPAVGGRRGLASRSSAEPPSGTGRRGRRSGRCHRGAGDRAAVPGVGRAVGT